jgi:hypothetical protein
MQCLSVANIKIPLPQGTYPHGLKSYYYGFYTLCFIIIVLSAYHVTFSHLKQAELSNLMMFQKNMAELT